MANSADSGLPPQTRDAVRDQLKILRHNVNNSLLLITSAAELIKLKPESAERLADQILDQQEVVLAQLREFGEKMENCLRITNDQSSA